MTPKTSRCALEVLAGDELLFDGVEFVRMIRYQMWSRQLKQHEVCDQTGISRPTLCRILSGKDPSIESYLRIKRWIGTPVARARQATSATIGGRDE